MATDLTESELDLSWLEELSPPADEEDLGAANFEAATSSLQLEALLSDQALTHAAIATLQV